MRILVKTSKIAIWARRLATFSVAVLLVSILFHIFGQIATDVFEMCLAIGTVFAVLAILCALGAYIRLWFSGDRGWGPASYGLLVGLLCMIPAAGAAALVVLYPSTRDVTTALVSPPELIAAEPGDVAVDPETVLESFPNLITRIYQVPPDALFSLAQAQVDQWHWEVLRSSPPSAESGQGVLNARWRSLLGWDSELAMRVAPGPLGSLIDLRAASLDPVRHDLGENGRAIEAFLLALDARVSAYQRNNMAESQESAEPEAEPATED